MGEVLSNRILTGFESIAQDLEKQGGGNALVVSQGMTIATLAHLLDPERGADVVLDSRAQITVLKYENSSFTIESFGDMSYRQRGAELIAQGNNERIRVSSLIFFLTSISRCDIIYIIEVRYIEVRKGVL